MAGLADDWKENRQTCVDVLCAYLRMPYTSDPGEEAREPELIAFRAEREVRHTVIRVIAAHLKADAAESWQGLNLDFTDVVFDGGDFGRTEFSGSTVSFNGARFSGGTTSFLNARFSGGEVSFNGATFSGGEVSFFGAQVLGLPCPAGHYPPHRQLGDVGLAGLAGGLEIEAVARCEVPVWVPALVGQPAVAETVLVLGTRRRPQSGIPPGPEALRRSNRVRARVAGKWRLRPSSYGEQVLLLKECLVGAAAVPLIAVLV
jgi:Pentapeptide repeats (9 copies)